MTAVAKKLQFGTAAAAIAVAAALTPATVAQADPAVVPLATIGGSLGGSSLVSDCPVGSASCESSAIVSGSSSISATSIFGPPPNIIQNQYWWFGPANPTPPPRTTIFAFAPLPLIPGFLQPAYSWFTQNLNFEACVAGLSVQVGPYGTVSGSVGSSC